MVQTFAKRILVVVFVAAPSVVSLGADEKEKFPRPREEMVEMPDGVKLATDVYVPEGPGPFPAIYATGPYGKTGLRSVAKSALERGYAFVGQDMRGRGKSQGDNAIIFHHEGWSGHRDGHDTLNWITRQLWSDGRVGSWGGSALGITQNMMAPFAPPSLRGQHVLVAFSDMYSQGVYQGGVFRKELMEGWLVANRITEKNLPAFVAHSAYDAFWKDLNPESKAFAVDCPGMFVGGWYDIFAQGTINSFVAIQHHGGPRARGRCRLVMGPIAHRPFNELKYPHAGLPPITDFLRYFDWVVRGVNNGVEKEKPVHYYVMGDPTDSSAPGNVWRAADDWPPPSKPTPFHFHADGALRRDRPTSSESREFTYDPTNPVPSKGGQNLLIPAGPMDQRSIEQRSDVLLFTSPVLEKPLEITGRITARIYLSSDCPDTDVTVKLTDVYPDGRSMLVTDGILRARRRISLEREDFLEPGKVYALNVDLWSTSLIVNKGHRIRVAVSSSNNPRFEPNPNTKSAFRADKETRVAKNRVHLSAEHPSSIILPVAGETIGSTAAAP